LYAVPPGTFQVEEEEEAEVADDEQESGA